MSNPSTPIKFISSVATRTTICVLDVSRPLNYDIITMTCGSGCALDIDDAACADVGIDIDDAWLADENRLHDNADEYFRTNDDYLNLPF